MAIQILDTCVKKQYQWSNCHQYVSICPEKAIKLVNKNILVENTCTQCQQCISACPVKAIINNQLDMQGQKLLSRRSLLGLSTKVPNANIETKLAFSLQLNISKCNLCGLCESHCANSCINISDSKLILNSQECTNCQLCVDICRTKALSVTSETHSSSPISVEIKMYRCSHCQKPYGALTPDTTKLCPACLFRQQNHLPIYKIGQNAISPKSNSRQACDSE